MRHSAQAGALRGISRSVGGWRCSPIRYACVRTEAHSALCSVLYVSVKILYVLTYPSLFSKRCRHRVQQIQRSHYGLHSGVRWWKLCQLCPDTVDGTLPLCDDVSTSINTKRGGDLRGGCRCCAYAYLHWTCQPTSRVVLECRALRYGGLQFFRSLSLSKGASIGKGGTIGCTKVIIGFRHCADSEGIVRRRLFVNGDQRDDWLVA